jgi:hypothetical protein
LGKNLEIAFLLDFYGSMLGEKQRRLFGWYYEDDLSLSEIADLEGMSRQGVRDAVKRAEQQLFAMEERLGLARRFQQMQHGLSEIRDCVQKLGDRCSDNPKAMELIGRLDTIVSELEQNETEA